MKKWCILQSKIKSGATEEVHLYIHSISFFQILFLLDIHLIFSFILFNVLLKYKKEIKQILEEARAYLSKQDDTEDDSA